MALNRSELRKGNLSVEMTSVGQVASVCGNKEPSD